MPENFKKILVIKLRALGDVILATPVLDNLHAAYAGAHIDFLTEQPSAPILQSHPAIHDLIVLDRKQLQALTWPARLRSNFELIRKLQRKKYDLVIDLFGNPRSALLTYLTRARVRAGYRFRVRRLAYNKIIEPRGDRVHEVEFNLDALRALEIPIVTKALRVEVPSLSSAEIAAFWHAQQLDSFSCVLGLNASGGWYTKRWPLRAYAELGDRLQRELGVKVILLWGPEEWREANAIAEMMATSATLAPATDLPQLAALLGRLHLLISNDSGPLHLAAALGTPVVGIYGPTRPELQGPWGKGHKVVFKAGLDCLGCNGVTCKIRTHDCMEKLEVARVFDVVAECLKPEYAEG